jgi:hypothetical protein
MALAAALILTMGKEKWERVGEENIQTFNIVNLLVYNT